MNATRTLAGFIACLAGLANAQPQEEAAAPAKWKRHATSALTIELPATWKPVAVSEADWAKVSKDLDPRLALRLEDPNVRKGFVWMAYDATSLTGRFITSMNVRKRDFTKLDRATFESSGFRKALIKALREQFEKIGFEDVNIDSRPLAKDTLSLTIETHSAGSEDDVKSLTVQHLLLRYPNLWYLSFTGDAKGSTALRKLSRRAALSFGEPDMEVETRKFSFGRVGLPKGWVAIDLAHPGFDAERERIATEHSELVVKAIDRVKATKADLFAFAPETVDSPIIETVNLRRHKVKGLTDARTKERMFLRKFEAEIRRGLTNAGMLVLATNRAPFGKKRPGLSIDYQLRTQGGVLHGRQYALFAPPNAWFLTFTTSKARATPQRLEGFDRCAAAFER